MSATATTSLGIDVGGTFTDLFWLDDADGSSGIAKVRTETVRQGGLPGALAASGIDLARCRDLEPGAQGVAFQSADHRHRAVAHRLAELMDHGDEAAAILRAAHVGHVVDVGATDEGAAAGAGEHDDPQVALARQRLEGLGEIEQRRRIEHVQAARVIVGDVGHDARRTAVPGDVDLVRSRHWFRSVGLC